MTDKISSCVSLGEGHARNTPCMDADWMCSNPKFVTALAKELTSRTESKAERQIRRTAYRPTNRLQTKLPRYEIRRNRLGQNRPILAYRNTRPKLTHLLTGGEVL